MGWLTAAVVLVALSLLVFGGGLRGPAVTVTVVDDAVVRWLGGLQLPGLLGTMRAVAALGSWTAINLLLWGLLLALLVLRRVRHLLVVLVAWILEGVVVQILLAPLLRRPRPFGVEFRTEALPSQLRRMLRERGRDLHAEFLPLLPARPRPIRIQRWSARRIGLLVLVASLTALLAVLFPIVLVNNDQTTTLLNVSSLDCDQPEPLWLQAQSVPSASLVPCVSSLPAGWRVVDASEGPSPSAVRNGWSRFTLAKYLIGFLDVRLSATCDLTGATQRPSGQPGAQRYERTGQGSSGPAATWHTVFAGGCVTAQLDGIGAADPAFATEASSIVDFTTRHALQQALERRSGGRLQLDP